MDKEFRKKLDEATARVDAWPEWKKGILENSFKSTNSKPREIVRLDHLIKVTSCANCPLLHDPDPYPCHCNHPNGNCDSYLSIDGTGDCPLRQGDYVVKLEKA